MSDFDLDRMRCNRMRRIMVEVNSNVKRKRLNRMRCIDSLDEGPHRPRFGLRAVTQNSRREQGGYDGRARSVLSTALYVVRRVAPGVT